MRVDSEHCRRGYCRNVLLLSTTCILLAGSCTVITVFVPGCREEAGSDLKGYGLFKRIVAERSSTETEFDPFLHVLSSEYPLWPDILERLYGESDDPTYKAAVIKIMCALADNQRQVQVVDGRLERILREGLFSDETDLAALCVQTLTRKAVFRQHEELLLKRLETVNDTRLITEIICALPSELAANAVMAQLCLPSSSCGNKEFRQWQLRSRYFIEGLRLRNRAGIWDLPIKSYMKLAESLMNAMANDESLISPLGVEALLAGR